MASVAHILETALLFLLAFLLGGGLGHWSRHLLAAWRRRQPAARVEADPATEAPPAIPVPATSILGHGSTRRDLAAAPAHRPPELRPARVAGEVYSGGQLPMRLSGGRGRHDTDLAPVELAAMRAVEGDWSPLSGPVPAEAVPPPEPAMVPDDDAEAAMAGARAAVAAASAAAEAALAPAPETPAPTDAGRPPSLAAPRPGGTDDLCRIAGITAGHAAGLHALGIFHFDQIASWNDQDIDWIETHLRPEARVRRDRWVQQARALAGKAPLRPRRPPDASSSP